MTNGFGSRYSIQLSYGCWKLILQIQLSLMLVLAVLRIARYSLRFATTLQQLAWRSTTHKAARCKRLAHPAELRVLDFLNKQLQ